MVTTNGLNLTGTTTDRNHHHRGFNCPAHTVAAVTTHLDGAGQCLVYPLPGLAGCHFSRLFTTEKTGLEIIR